MISNDCADGHVGLDERDPLEPMASCSCAPTTATPAQPGRLAARQRRGRPRRPHRRLAPASQGPARPGPEQARVGQGVLRAGPLGRADRRRRHRYGAVPTVPRPPSPPREPCSRRPSPARARAVTGSGAATVRAAPVSAGRKKEPLPPGAFGGEGARESYDAPPPNGYRRKYRRYPPMARKAASRGGRGGLRPRGAEPAAYARSDLFKRRRRLMDDWAAYLGCESGTGESRRR